MCFSNMCNAEFCLRVILSGRAVLLLTTMKTELLLHPCWHPPWFCFMLLFYLLWGRVYLYRARRSCILALAEALLSFLSVCCHAVHCVCRWWISVFRGKWTSCCIFFCFLFFVFIFRYFKTPNVFSYFIFKVKALKGLAHPDILLHIWFTVLFSFPSVPQIFIKWMDIHVMVFR